MAAEVIMPALGMAQDSGTVLRWLKAKGDAVEQGEPLAEVETDKATVEIEAPATGILGGVRAPEGAEVPVGTVIALVLAPGEAEERPMVDEHATVDQRGAVEERAATAQRAALAEASRAADAGAAVKPSGGAGPPSAPRPRASPRARRLAQARGIDIASLPGSGPRGAVVARDLGQAAKPAGGGEHVALPAAWRSMAERVARSWREVPHFVLWREVDATRLRSWRQTARRRSGCERVSYTDLLVRVCAEALRRHPRVNASWRDGVLVPGAGVNIAIATATEEGLVAPVVREAHTLDLAAISARRRQLTEAARARRLRPEDLQDATFTISNLGMYGVDAFQAVVSSPQAAVLAVGRILERPVAVDATLAVRPLLTLTVSFDHRAIDGARGAQFLDTLASLLEEPAGLVT
jgi:pyruvate dehydrogenase E2 component (dihydrolipoamide acetyltransferase)